MKKDDFKKKMRNLLEGGISFLKEAIICYVHDEKYYDK